MRHTKKVLGVCIAFVLVLGLQAQTAATTSGGEASGSGGTISYTIGQVAYTSNTGANGSVNQGVQHVYEISAVSGFNIPEISLNISVYPNPVADYLVLFVDTSATYSIQHLKYELYNVQGRLLLSKELNNYESHIDMGNLAPSTYFIKVVNDNKEIKIFQVIKSN